MRFRFRLETAGESSGVRAGPRAAGCWAFSRGDPPAADPPAAGGELPLRLRLTTLEAKTRSGRGVPNRLWLRQTPAVFIIAGARKLMLNSVLMYSFPTSC